MKLIPRRRERPREMTIVEHLAELRTRLVVSAVAIAAGSVVGWFLFEPFLDMIRKPFCEALSALPEKAQPPTGCDLVFNGPVEPFMIKLKVVVFIGLLIALPILLWQFWLFITPGLTKKEKRYAVPFIGSSVLLFALGASLAYLTLPLGLQFLLGFAGEGFVPLLTASRYIGFFILMTLAFGIAFEFPIILIFLCVVGIISSRQLRSWRRYAVVAVCLLAAVITPSQDPYTLLAMAVPMYLFYEAAILVARLLKK
ncbi:MAG: twin-arginine translocase subunit TatC [Actinomycetota bacterium]